MILLRVKTPAHDFTVKGKGMTTFEILELTKNAKGSIASLSSENKNALLGVIAEHLEHSIDEILRANDVDLFNAEGTVGEVMLDRLRLTRDRIKAMACGIRDIAALPDPVGRILSTTTRGNGLKINKVSVPFGVIGIIYESRPNVTSDAAALCIKSGNACVLRCGKEAHNTCSAIVEVLKKAILETGLNPDIINLVEDTSRQSAHELMTANGYIDLLIPRGGAGLIKAVTQSATVPCIETGTGICHIYIDEYADLNKAIGILYNAKTSRPSVCNAAECCLIDERIADKALPLLKKTFVDNRIDDNLPPVELRLCEKALRIIPGTPATEEDYNTEFLNYILAVKVVSGVDEAVCHIRAHSTGHSEAIISENEENINKFLQGIDSAALYVNASTRFTDGGEFGMGCEMGISTQKLHARGPMGLNELNTYKYIIYGNGQIR